MLQKLGAFDFEKNYRKLLKAAIVMTVLFKMLLMGLFFVGLSGSDVHSLRTVLS